MIAEKAKKEASHNYERIITRIDNPVLALMRLLAGINRQHQIFVKVEWEPLSTLVV